MAVTIAPTISELQVVSRSHLGDDDVGPLPKLWRRMRYHVPEVYYEALLAKLIHAGVAWLDVGAGCSPLPGNPSLGAELAERCGLMVGLDPDRAVLQNSYAHRKVHCKIEDFHTDEKFDVVTMRMVAEHIDRPHDVLRSLASLTKKGGHVVVYTVNRWSPVSLVSWLVPFQLHYPAKKLLWDVSSGKGTFPVSYQMNTRGALKGLFRSHGFQEAYFAYLGDCRTFFRFALLHFAEVLTWRVLQTAGVVYPENCLLGVYRRG